MRPWGRFITFLVAAFLILFDGIMLENLTRIGENVDRMKKISESFPYGSSTYNESDINSIGLKIIHIIRSSKIKYDSPELKALLKDIKDTCKDSHVWVLYGSQDKNKWIPLQVASRNSENVISEIRTDFLCMTPFNKMRDEHLWNSYFYESVVKIRYGYDAKCQKYKRMKNMCKYLAIAILKNEENLEGVRIAKDKEFSKYQKKECDIALEIKPLFWNPAGVEFTYIQRMNKN